MTTTAVSGAPSTTQPSPSSRADDADDEELSWGRDIDIEVPASPAPKQKWGLVSREPGEAPTAAPPNAEAEAPAVAEPNVDAGFLFLAEDAVASSDTADAPLPDEPAMVEAPALLDDVHLFVTEEEPGGSPTEDPAPPEAVPPAPGMPIFVEAPAVLNLEKLVEQGKKLVDVEPTPSAVPGPFRPTAKLAPPPAAREPRKSGKRTRQVRRMASLVLTLGLVAVLYLVASSILGQLKARIVPAPASEEAPAATVEAAVPESSTERPDLVTATTDAIPSPLERWQDGQLFTDDDDIAAVFDGVAYRPGDLLESQGDWHVAAVDAARGVLVVENPGRERVSLRLR